MSYPEAFCARMKRILGDEYPAFAAAFETADPVRALRVNPLKLSPLRLPGRESLEPVPYTPDGFFIREEDAWGARALHRAGGYYLQDPAAMAPVAAAPVASGWRVLDLCASPGGKTGQLAAAVGDRGLVISNELNPTRARTLGGNVERLGLRQTVVMNADGAYVASLFPRFFDLVLVDAPCSGEGMFRKNPEAVVGWSPEAVAHCAALQRPLLEAAADAVRPGGYLLYATCTFSTEENEQQVDTFLAGHPEFSLVPAAPTVASVTAPGLDFGNCRNKELSLCRRFYPHRSPGEGQFFALMKRAGDGEPAGVPAYHDEARPLTAAEEAIAQAFFDSTLTERPAGRLCRVGDHLALLPAGLSLPPHCVLQAGVNVGEIQKNRLVPHHQFFSAYGHRFRRQIELEETDRRLAAFLHGESFSANVENGWGVVTVCGCALGGIKAVDGTAKNHYPKGLRS